MITDMLKTLVGKDTENIEFVLGKNIKEQKFTSHNLL